MATGVNHKHVFLQDLPEEEPRADLMEEGQEDVILQKCCPSEYKDLKEEEVRGADTPCNVRMRGDSSNGHIALMSHNSTRNSKKGFKVQCGN